MIETILIALALGLVALMFRRRVGDRTRWPVEQLIRDYTVHIHRASGAGRPMGRFLPETPRIHPAAAELHRRGLDPDRALAEFFDAKREGRAPDWNICRGPGAS